MATKTYLCNVFLAQNTSPSPLSNVSLKTSNNTFAFLNGRYYIDGRIRYFVHMTAWPTNLQFVDLRLLPQAEVNSWIIARQITLTRADGGILNQIACR